MCKKAPKLITIGVIAEAVGASPDRIRRILQTRSHIRPAAYAGHTRLFTSNAIAQIRHELNAIDARKAAGKGVKS